MAVRTLVIAEKPAQGKEIAHALGAIKFVDGAMESGEFTVSWAVGHLVTLKEPDEYGDKWKKWSFDTLPILPENYELKIIDLPHVKKQFSIVKKLLTSKQFTRVVNACDAGREGELIFDYLYRLSGCKIPAYRLWTSAALTPDAIKREFQKLKPIEEFNGLRLAARARAQADWAIGMNATRALTLAMQQTQKPSTNSQEKNGKDSSYSVGRVQTPTLQFLVSRETEIRNFISKPFWTIYADLFTRNNENFKGRFEYKNEGAFIHQIYSQTDAQNIFRDCEGKEAKVAKIDSKEGSTPPPLLFDLTDLQKECNKRFSLSADETLKVAQELYEKHKCVSYPRTEYRYLTEDNREMIPDIVKALKGRFDDKFLDQVKNTYKNQNKRIFNNEKVGDHHAMIPTSSSPNNLNELEGKVYTLIVNRFLAAFAPDFEYSASLIASVCGKHLFVTRGRMIKNQGWKLIENEIHDENEPKNKDNNENEEQKLPLLKVGDMIKIQRLNLKEDKTKPPPRYNDASLLSAMQNPASKTDNKDDKELLRECGLGTPATRAAIISKLEKSGYLKREKKNLLSTLKAFELMDMLKKYNQSFLSNPVLTGEWEKVLQEIEKQPNKAYQFSEKLNALTGDIVKNMKKSILME